MSAHSPSAAASPAIQRQRQRRRVAIRLLIVFLVALVARSGWGIYRFSRVEDPAAVEFDDERQYWMMAASLRAGDGLQDELGFRATRMPLYPGVLSAFTEHPRGVMAARALQWLIGAVGAVFAAMVAMTLFDLHVGFLAGFLVALDPFLIFFSSLLLTETAYVTFLLLLWWLVGALLRTRGCTSHWSWIAVGAAASLCVYQRESCLGLSLVAIGWIVICRRFERRTLAGAAVAVGVVVLTLIPWALRNERTIGEWCWLTTRAGISLYDGVGSQASGASDLADVKQMPEVRELSEVEWNRYFLDQSWAAIRNSPARIGRLAVTKLSRTWNPFPNVESYQSRMTRAVSVLWIVPVYLLAAAGAGLVATSQEDRCLRTVVFLLLPALYLSAVHCFFVGSVRYRLGAMPMLEILAAVTIVAVLNRTGVLKTGGGKRSAD